MKRNAANSFLAYGFRHLSILCLFQRFAEGCHAKGSIPIGRLSPDLAFSGMPNHMQAQSSYRPVVRPPTPSTPIIASSSSDGKTTEGPLSSVEMQIELAWLADPV